MTGVIIVLVMALVFLILGIILLNGKGSWLIAGYNTASSKEKEKYDEKKICRATGIVCEVCFVILGIMAFLGYRVEAGFMNENALLPFAAVASSVIIIAVIGAIVYMNTAGKTKK